MEDYLKTILLLGGLSALVVLIGGFIGGEQGLYLAFFISLLINGVAYFFSDKLAISSSGAKPLERRAAPEVYEMVEELTGELKIPMPKLYVIPTPQANAFATGRSPGNASVALTEGIMQTLNWNELKAVIAHELGHVKNRDILIASIAAVLASVVAFMARIGIYSGSSEDRRVSGGFMLILALLAPLAATIIQLAVSRNREFEADETGAETLGSGQDLASALIKIQDSTRRNPNFNVNPAFSSLFIENPFGDTKNNFLNLFSTHPPVEERIKRLMGLKLR